jgi:hypothetical protein
MVEILSEKIALVGAIGKNVADALRARITIDQADRIASA